VAVLVAGDLVRSGRATANGSSAHAESAPRACVTDRKVRSTGTYPLFITPVARPPTRDFRSALQAAGRRTRGHVPRCFMAMVPVTQRRFRLVHPCWRAKICFGLHCCLVDHPLGLTEPTRRAWAFLSLSSTAQTISVTSSPRKSPAVHHNSEAPTRVALSGATATAASPPRHQAAMGPGASTSAQPLTRLLLSLPNPGAARHPRSSSSSSPSQPRPDVAAARSPGLVLRRREAAAALLSTAFLSRFALPAAAADGGECPLEVAPSGLAFCDRVVGTGAAAQEGQLIRVCTYRSSSLKMISLSLVSSASLGACRRITRGGWRTARCSTAATSAGSRSPSALASERYRCPCWPAAYTVCLSRAHTR
jgi:hypothetical protein